MCRATLRALALLVVAAPLAAQRRDPARVATLLARAESLQAAMQKKDRALQAEVATQRRGQVVQSGRVVLVLWEMIDPAAGQRLAAAADSTLAAFGAGPAALLDRIVYVQLWTTDTARILSRPAMAHRRSVALEWVDRDRPDVGAAKLVSTVALQYRGTLDSAWQRWLPRDYGLAWIPRPYSDWALAALTDPDAATGEGCLAGRAAQCRLWLGLDDDARPIAMRYHASEIRRRLTGRTGYSPGVDRQRCVDGDDPACIRYAETRPVVNSIPAPDIARASFVRALWALHGPEAVGRAFADTHGAVGDRFARAAGIREDSLVAEWRAWTLGRGRRDPLAAGAAQSVFVLLVVAVAVWAATRSGRWR